MVLTENKVSWYETRPCLVWMIIKNKKTRKVSHSPSPRTGGEIVVPEGWGCNYCARLLSVFRQAGPHLWHRGPAVSRQQLDSNLGPSTLACLRQAFQPTELPPSEYQCRLCWPWPAHSCLWATCLQPAIKVNRICAADFWPHEKDISVF